MGDDPIKVVEARRMMKWILRDKKLTGDMLRVARAQVLEEIVKRRLVLAYARCGDAPIGEELTKAKKQFQNLLAAQGRKVADVPVRVDDPGRSRPEIYGLASLSGQVLHAQTSRDLVPPSHRDLDGTELVVSHILLRPAAGASRRRRRIGEAGRFDPREIAPANSILPRPGKILRRPQPQAGRPTGKIGRQAPQDESFSDAEFKLKAGEISPPVRSRFGVHLIRCGGSARNEESYPIHRADRPGLDQGTMETFPTRTPALGSEYTSAWPRFKPGTRRWRSSTGRKRRRKEQIMTIPEPE